MSNTITAYFKGRVGVAESVYQNDYGIVMAFDGIYLPSPFDCYFSKINQEEAVPGIGTDNRVVIPNSILADPGNMTIHIPLHDGAYDSEVEYVVYFKVIGRARPVDDGAPAQMTAVERALALLSQPITNIEEIVNEALSMTGDTFQEMKEDLQGDYSDFTEEVNEDISAFKSEVRGRVTDVEADFSDLSDDFDNLEAQFNTAVAAVTTDTEVTNIRVGDDGKTYGTAGEAVRKQFRVLKNDVADINGLTRLSYSSGYINTGVGVGNTVSLTPTAHSSYVYAITSCSEGDRFVVSGTSGTNPRVWAFIDSNNKLLVADESNKTRTDVIVVAPENAAKAVFNSGATDTYYCIKGTNRINRMENEITDASVKLKFAFTDKYNLIDGATVWTSGGYKYRKFAVTAGETYFYNQLASGTTAWVDVFSTADVRLGNIVDVFGVDAWNTTVTIPDGVGYIRIMADGTDAYADTMYWGYQSNYSKWQSGKRISLKSTVDIGSSGETVTLINIGVGTDYPLIKDGFAYAVENDCGVVIQPGTYNLNDEGITIDDLGLIAPKVVYGYGAKLTLAFGTYETSDPSASAINIGAIPSCEIYGLTIYCKNARYCIHDEMYNYAADYYHHVFKDLTLIHECDTGTSGLWVAPRCIGGGLGNGGFIEIENCMTYSVAYEDINYHSKAGGSQTGEATIIIKDSAMRKNASVANAGLSTDYMNKMFVSNCIVGKTVADGENINIKKISWNMTNLASTNEFDSLFNLLNA